MLRKLAIYVLLLNFVNTMFFHELPPLGACEASPFAAKTGKTSDIRSLTELALQVWWEMFGGKDLQDQEDWLEPASAEKDFISPLGSALPLHNFALAPSPLSALDPDLPGYLKEIIPPPPQS